jgi:hypothetical protein
MHKNAMKCNKTQSKWCINKHGASKIIDTFETYQGNTPQTDRKKKAKVPISVNPKIQFTWRKKLQGTKGRCTEHHHTSQGKQVTL